MLIYRDGVLVLAFIFKSLWERRNVSVNIQGDDIRLYPPWKLNTLAFSSLQLAVVTAAIRRERENTFKVKQI